MHSQSPELQESIAPETQPCSIKSGAYYYLFIRHLQVSYVGKRNCCSTQAEHTSLAPLHLLSAAFIAGEFQGLVYALTMALLGALWKSYFCIYPLLGNHL